MKKMLLAAGIGLTLITASMAMSSDNYSIPQSQAIAKDTVPDKDTTDPKPKPKPDSSSIVLRLP